MRRLRRTLVQPPDYRANERCLNHLERCLLMDQPLPLVRIIPSDKSWAGAYINRDRLPAHAVKGPTPLLVEEDEFIQQWLVERGVGLRDNVLEAKIRK